MPHNTRSELDALNDTAESLHALAIRMCGVLVEMRDQLNTICNRTHSDIAPLCRHDTPIGDYCAYCAETPEG